jgi:Fuc2NAc and GlcNAc transferase
VARRHCFASTAYRLTVGSHAYQCASRRFGRHLLVTLAVLGINLLWLLPIALWVGLGGLNGLLVLLVTYLPLVVLAVRFKAGERE